MSLCLFLDELRRSRTLPEDYRPCHACTISMALLFHCFNEIGRVVDRLAVDLHPRSNFAFDHSIRREFPFAPKVYVPQKGTRSTSGLLTDLCLLCFFVV
jgi:hypothetical protein